MIIGLFVMNLIATVIPEPIRMYVECLNVLKYPLFTKIFFQVTTNNRPICRECKNGFLIRQYSESELNNQISYYRYMFDLEAHSEARKYFKCMSMLLLYFNLLFLFNRNQSPTSSGSLL